jgi:outer membrane protein
MKPLPVLLALALAAGARAEAPARVLGLDEAVETALARQPQLAASRAAAEAARGRADQARAALLPQVGVLAQLARRTANPVVRIDGLAATLDSRTDLSFSATASQLVWDFGQSTGRHTAARRSADVQAETARETTVATVLDVRTAFFAARAARDLAGVARATLENQRAHLAQTDAFVRIGTRPPIDLATARTAVANAQVRLVQADNDYATARSRLNQAMGVEGALDFDVGGDTLPAVDGEDAAAAALVNEALRGRPDLAAAQLQIEATEASLGAARGGYAPSLSAGVSATDAGSRASDLPDRWNLSAGATLTWALFEGGRTRGQVAEAAANVSGAVAQRDAVRQRIRVELESAQLTVRAAKASLEATADALDSAREQLRLAEGRYRTGAGSALELADAQLAETSAEAQQVNAQYQLASARAQLLAALGRP